MKKSDKFQSPLPTPWYRLFFVQLLSIGQELSCCFGTQEIITVFTETCKWNISWDSSI